MRRSLRIQKEPIDEVRLQLERAISKEIGAVIYFLGTVREQEQEIAIRAIEYEAFEEMAIHQFNRILDEVQKQWPIESARIVHRIGEVRVSDPSLWVEMTAPHRGEAFAACQYLIDEMKKRVPIWKKPLPPNSPIS
jgi:molybdopterin synthase catalytic subunit